MGENDNKMLRKQIIYTNQPLQKVGFIFPLPEDDTSHNINRNTYITKGEILWHIILISIKE